MLSSINIRNDEKASGTPKRNISLQGSEPANGTYRLIFLSPHDPRNVRAWSGTVHFLYNSLKKLDPGIVAVGGGPVERIAGILHKIGHKLGIAGDFRHTRAYGRLVSAVTSLLLAFKKGDAIVAIAASTHVYAIRTSRPIIYISDATFASIARSYSDFAAFPNWMKEDGSAVEAGALAHSDHIIYPCEWAKELAMNDYHVPERKITVLPFGANIDKDTIKKFQTVKAADFSGGVNLLFVGTSWQRKGGPVALEVRRIIEGRGIHCNLFLVGKCDTDLQQENGIQNIGNLDKSDPIQLMKLCQLYEEAHFLILPTRQEAFGIVFSEAQAFGCPSLAYAVGGVTTAIKDEETGFTLPLDATPNEFAAKILALVDNPKQYEEMSLRCQQRYEAEANWDNWAQKVSQLVKEACHSRNT